MASSSFSSKGISIGRICLEEGVGGCREPVLGCQAVLCTDNWLGWGKLASLNHEPWALT